MTLREKMAQTKHYKTLVVHEDGTIASTCSSLQDIFGEVPDTMPISEGYQGLLKPFLPAFMKDARV